MAEDLRIVDAPANEERTHDFWLRIGCVGPADAHASERHISRMREQQQLLQQRQALGGAAELAVKIDAPIAFSPHGYSVSRRFGDDEKQYRL